MRTAAGFIPGVGQVLGLVSGIGSLLGGLLGGGMSLQEKAAERGVPVAQVMGEEKRYGAAAYRRGGGGL